MNGIPISVLLSTLDVLQRARDELLAAKQVELADLVAITGGTLRGHLIANLPQRLPVKPAGSISFEQWNRGARLADDECCQTCGARGYRGTCPSCERAA